MKKINRIIAGQSIFSWILQMIFVYMAWMVVKHKIPNNSLTIIGAAVLMLIIYISLATTNKKK